MAVVSTSSTLVANWNASPRKMNPGRYSHGRVRRLSDTVEIAAGDDDGSVYRLLPVHSTWSLMAIWIYNDAITAGTDFDLGLYNPTSGDSAVVDVNVYGDAIDMSSARTAPLDALNEIRDIASVNNQIWQDLGLSSDPNLWYDLALTGVTVGSAAGTLAMTALYTAGD